MAVAAGILFVSCVPLKKFKLKEQENLTLEQQMSDLIEANQKFKVDNTELASRVLVLQRQVNRLEEQNQENLRALQAAKDKLTEIQELYNHLTETNSRLSAGSGEEAKRLLSDIQKAQQDLLIRQDAVKKLEADLADKKSNLDRLRKEFQGQQARLIELERNLAAKDSVMNQIRDRVTRALYGFRPDELHVDMRNGMVYVSMEEKLLFRSGSFEVGSKGLEALQKLAGVLKNHPDIQILVEGHTDNVPYRTTSNLLIDNWDLSAKRATSIIRILLGSGQLAESRLTASGRGEFLPVNPNDTPEGRQKNRRTEIILSPKLDDLYRLIER